MEKYEVLKRYFGYRTFRAGQEEIVDAVLGGRDVCAIMPTGGGKSLCYQLPALLLSGITIVISPLISLMHDQVIALKEMGISAAYINHTLTAPQLTRVCRNIGEGVYRIVYVAPERLETEQFLSLMQTVTVSLVAVDEAHCISEWGQDFRPSYRHIVSFLQTLPYRPTVAAFTATATARVRRDIIETLALDSPLCVTTGFDRPNLYFEVISPRQKYDALEALVRARAGKSGIVYCMTRKLTESVCERLVSAGIAATKYHAGLEDAERHGNQEAFIRDEKTVMVATNAFGMGIDKSNVSFVIHYNMPLSMEAYYQEAGRAGRDGEPADCILLYSPGDIVKARTLIALGEEAETHTPEETELLLRQNYERLEHMIAYCKTTACLRGQILSYFGQEHPERCESCGNCKTDYVEEDVTVEAQKILSCIRRAKTHLGYPVGRLMIAKILAGSKEQRLIACGLDTISTYGIMAETPRERVLDLMERLEELHYISTDPEHGGVFVGVVADALLRGKETLRMTFKYQHKPERAKKKGKQTADMADASLYEALRQLRFTLAQKEGVPAYVVFSNSTLADMAARKPLTKEDFLLVSGVGEKKAKRYADDFLEAIRAYEEKNGGNYGEA